MRCLEKTPDQTGRRARASSTSSWTPAALPPWTEREADDWWDRHLPITSSLRSFAQTPTHTPAMVRKM